MAAKGISKLGVPFWIIAPYALPGGLKNAWHITAPEVVTPAAVLGLEEKVVIGELLCNES
jgi:hypothetical protein